MGWKTLFVILAWSLIGVIAALAFTAKAAIWAHDRLVRLGVKMMKWFGVRP